LIFHDDEKIKNRGREQKGNTMGLGIWKGKRRNIRWLVLYCYFFVFLFTLTAEGIPVFDGTYYQGDTIKIYFLDVDLPELSDNPDGEGSNINVRIRLSYRQNGKTIAESTCFPFSLPGDDETTIGLMGLLGVPSTLTPGKYLLEWKDREGQEGNRLITILQREFVHEDIPLNQTMTDLRQTPDPKKIEEYRQLIAILRNINQEHQFCTGRQAHPLPGGIYTSYFGDRRKYLYSDGNVASSIHNGIDLAAPIGTPVLAGGDGMVVFAGPRIITGNSVIVEHMPGMYGLYYHLDSISVKEGDMVKQGETLGTLGSTGLATGPHLHWEIRVAGVPVKPELLMEKPVIDKEEIIDKMNRLDHKGGD